jgi:hypothetical protein
VVAWIVFDRRRKKKFNENGDLEKHFMLNESKIGQ